MYKVFRVNTLSLGEQLFIQIENKIKKLLIHEEKNENTT